MSSRVNDDDDDTIKIILFSVMNNNYNYSNLLPSNKRYAEKHDLYSLSGWPEDWNGDTCCAQCGLYEEGTNFVSFSRGSCRCHLYTGTEDPEKKSGSSPNWNGGSCTPARRKRETIFSKDDNEREKRSTVNLETQRVIECAPLHGGFAAYWKYDYEIPASCTS